MSSAQEVFEKVKGTKRYTLLTTGTPNGAKIAVLLHELGIDDQCSSVPLDLMKGEQKQPWYNNLKIVPNGRVPGLIDHSAEDLAVWESGAIMMYLCEQHGGRFLGSGQRERADTLTYLMFQMAGVGPMQGQANWFIKFAPVDDAYGMQRYYNETKRLYGVLESVLASDKREYIIGSSYTIADIALLPWIGMAGLGGIELSDYPTLHAWLKRCVARPAVTKALEGSKIWPFLSSPEAVAGAKKAALDKMESAGAFGEKPAGGKAV